MSDEREIEKQLQERGLNAPRLNPDMINETIVSIDYHVFHGKHTICCLTLKNGFTVFGESACVDLKNFDREIGRDISYENARRKIWPLEGYLLQQRGYLKGVSKDG